MKRLLILFLFVACQSNPETKDAPDNSIEQEPTISPLEFYCFYKLDDKYCDVKDPVVIDSWIKQKSYELASGDVKGDLFEHNGGGPNGAEWNPSTDLYIVVNRVTKIFGIKQNELDYKYMQFEEDQYAWIKISNSEMNDRLIDISDENWNLMFPNGNDSKQTTDFDGGIQLPKTGKIIRFDLKCDDQSLVKFFYAAFGE